MSETKWTPGPWTMEERGAYSDFDGNSRVISGEFMRVAVVHTDGRSEFEANASLIASAPALYAALEAMVGAFDTLNVRSLTKIHPKLAAVLAARTALEAAQVKR